MSRIYSSHPNTLGDCRVLLLEDEPLILFTLEEEMRELGFGGVSGARNTGAAQAILDSERIDVAILDIHLGADTSFAIARTLRTRGIPFIFATGSQGDDVPPDLRDVPFLDKPFITSQVETTLLATLGSSAPLHSGHYPEVHHR